MIARDDMLNDPSCHAANCVCVECLARRPGVTPLEAELRAERGRADSIVRLDT